MSRGTISTGGIDFNLSDQASETLTRNSQTPMHIAILGDFSGRKSRAAEQLDSLDGRKLIDINRDNFDEVFEKLAVKLQLPVSEQCLEFRELDDLHPDFIYERIGLFDKLRILKRKLKKKDRFDSAAEEIQSWAGYKGSQTDKPNNSDGIAMPDSLLNAALQGYDISRHINQGPLGNIDTLIKDIVAPFIEAKTDPRQTELINAVDAATSETLRAIMHHSDFQQLEASWRSLYWLIRKIEAGSNLRFYMMDISQQELRADINKPRAQSHLYQQLVESRCGENSTSFSLIIGDYTLKHTHEDAQLASQMATLAASSGAYWLSGGHEQLAGCTALSAGIDPDEWQIDDTEDASKVEGQWQEMRNLATAQHLILAAPRFLLRLPYGSKTSSTDSFDFEELSQRGAHGFYLWGNAAFLVAGLLAQTYSRFGWESKPCKLQDIENLPLHIYEHDGDQTLKPCAEVLLTDRGSAALMQAGILVLRSIHNKDTICVPHFQTVDGKTIEHW